MGTIGSSVLSNNGLKLRVWFNDGVKNWQQFSPDQKINYGISAISNYRNDADVIKLKSVLHYYTEEWSGGSGWSNDSKMPIYLLGSNPINYLKVISNSYTVKATFDLTNQIPAGSRICSVCADCYDTAPAIKAQFSNVRMTGSIKMELVLLSDTGLEAVVASAETGSVFVGGSIQLKMDNLLIINEGAVFLRIYVPVENITDTFSRSSTPTLSGRPEILRLDRVVVGFK